MKQEKDTLKALLALCMAALAALAIAGCAGSSGASSAESASGSGDGSGDASGAAAGVSAILGGSGDSSSASGSAGSSGSSSASGPYINSGASASSNASSGSSTSGTSTGASGSSATTASGTLVEIMNDEGGYLFKTDKAFTTETSGQSTTVYTGGKSGAVPYFKLTLMGNRTGQSVDDLLASTADRIVEDYGDRIVVEPTFNVVDLGNRKITGFEYVYKSESGNSTLYAMNYVEDIDSTFYTWTGVYYSGDGTTPAAMQQAAATLMVRS